MPAAMRSSVLLPLPFGPISTTFCPRSTCRSTSTSTTWSPYACPISRSIKHVALRAAVRRELEVHLRFLLRPLDALDPRDRFLAALHRRRLRRLRAEPLDEPLLPIDLAVLPGRRAVELLQLCGLLLLVVGVVARVRLDHTVTQLDDPVRHAIEELRVVRDDQHDALVLRQIVGQPLFRRDVQVVRRLVQQHVVRPPHEDLRQRDPHLPATAERPAELLAVCGREPQPVQHPPDPRIDAIAVHRFVRIEQPPLLVDQRIEIALAALDLAGDLVQLEVDGARLRERRPHLVDEPAVGIVPGLLLQVAERAAAVPACALVRAHLPRRSASAASTCRRRSARPVRRVRLR